MRSGNSVYIGTLEQQPDGRVIVRKPAISSRPEDPRGAEPYPLPARYAKAIKAGRLHLVSVRGDSMEPVILDNDQLVVDFQIEPQEGDVVSVWFTPDVSTMGMVARCREVDGVLMLVKDNDCFADYARPLADAADVAVVVAKLPRVFRHSTENHERLETEQAMLLEERAPATLFTDLGFYTPENLRRIRLVVDVPNSELTGDGRLPWGLFRAFATREHALVPDVTIAAGDCIVLDPSAMETQSGDVVFGVEKVTDEPVIGVLQRDVSGTWHIGSRPSETVRKLGIVAAIARPLGVALRAVNQ